MKPNAQGGYDLEGNQEIGISLYVLRSLAQLSMADELEERVVIASDEVITSKKRNLAAASGLDNPDLLQPFAVQFIEDRYRKSISLTQTESATLFRHLTEFSEEPAKFWKERKKVKLQKIAKSMVHQYTMRTDL